MGREKLGKETEKVIPAYRKPWHQLSCKGWSPFLQADNGGKGGSWETQSKKSESSHVGSYQVFPSVLGGRETAGGRAGGRETWWKAEASSTVQVGDDSGRTRGTTLEVVRIGSPVLYCEGGNTSPHNLQPRAMWACTSEDKGFYSWSFKFTLRSRSQSTLLRK